MKNPKDRRMVRLYKLLIDLELSGKLGEMGAEEIATHADTHYGTEWCFSIPSINAAASHLKSMRLAATLKWNTEGKQGGIP